MTGSEPQDPIFIIGTERSGSNLLRLILNAHPRITIPHPPHFMRYFGALSADYGDLAVERNRRRLVLEALGLLRRHIHPWPHPVDADRVLAESEPTLFGVVAAIYEQHRRAEGKARWGCKSTFMVGYVDQVRARYPDARFVWLVREPRDVAASAKKHVFGPCHPYRMARLWLAEQELAAAARDRLGPGVVHLLRYEDLVTDTEAELRRLCDFLGERFDPAMLRHQASASARQTAGLAEAWKQAGEPVSTGRIGGHTAGLTSRERLLVDKVTGAMKKTLGYPVDPDSESEPEPALPAVLLRSAVLRVRVETRSMRADRNYRLRLGRHLYVRRLRLAHRLHGFGRTHPMDGD
jgi:hypothetical protein